MNTFERLRAAGVSYTLEDGRLKYKARAERLTPEVLETLHKAKGYLETCQDGDRSWGNVPPDDIPPRKGLPRITFEQEELVFAHIERQPDQVLHWALRRSNVYEELHPGIELRRAHLAAALDVLRWQRPDLPAARDIIEELESLERTHQFFARRKSPDKS